MIRHNSRLPNGRWVAAPDPNAKLPAGKVRCPCCGGSGEIDERAPVRLTPLQFRIYEIVRKSKYGITGPALVTRTYADRADGGPDCANISVAVTIKTLNARLATVGQKIAANGTHRYILQPA